MSQNRRKTTKQTSLNNDTSGNRTWECTEKERPTYLASLTHYPNYWATEQAMHAGEIFVHVNFCRLRADIRYTVSFASVKGKMTRRENKPSSIYKQITVPITYLCVWNPRREAGDVWCLPPVWNLKAVIWFHFALSSLALLPSPVTLSVLSFSACWPFLLNFFQKILQYFSLRDRLFCTAPV